MPEVTDRGNEALLLARALKRGAADKTSSKRLKEIIHILWNHQIYKGPTPEKLKSTMIDLGPTFVKAAQVMSARRDMFPEEYCDAFATLRSTAPPMTFHQVEERLDKAYDGDYKTIFRRVNKRPLGSASVAQVHKAILRHGGDVVAVKVQRPNVRKLMTEDIELLRRANDLLEISAAHSADLQNIDITAFVDELDRTVREEIDFTHEAQNLESFRTNCEDEEYVTSPKVYENLTSETVLVMEYVEGPTIEDTRTLDDMGIDVVEVGNLIAQNYVKQLLHDGLFHADPHAGNIIVHEGPSIEWIDLGMVGRLTETECSLLRKLFLAVASRDAQELKNVLLVWGRPVGEVNHGKLLSDLDSMLSRYASDSIADIDLSAAMADLLSLIREQHIAMPASFTMLARGIMTLEGTLEALAPEISIIGVIEEYLRSHILDDFNLTDEMKNQLLALRKLSHKAVGIPSQVSDLLDMMEKGEMTMQVSAKGLTKMTDRLEGTIDRATLGMITAGLFIGSSMLCMTAMEPRVLGIPVIGFLGYLGALVLSIYIVLKGRP